jgi:phosphopantothenoylcysteine synthetase/decarboxylase
VPDHLALIACGAPLAARVHDVAAAAVEAGWLVRVLATPAALLWVDQAAAERATGYPVLVEQRQPDQAKRFPPPAHVIVCPATFNTVNKLAAGIMDNYPAGLLCEALASRIPITAVPMVSTRLWDHPVWQRNLEMLTAAGVTFLDIRTGRAGNLEPVVSGTGDEVVAAFDPAWPLTAAGRPAQKAPATITRSS